MDFEEIGVRVSGIVLVLILVLGIAVAVYGLVDMLAPSHPPTTTATTTLYEVVGNDYID